jgi:hypothetical protein
LQDFTTKKLRCHAVLCSQEWQSLVSALEAAGVEVLTAEAQGLPDPRTGYLGMVSDELGGETASLGCLYNGTLNF